MKPFYYIVYFPKDNSVDVVPSNWLLNNNTKSHWPEDTDVTKIIKLVQKAVDPTECPKINWKVYDCQIRCGADSYEKAKSGVDKAVENSEFEFTDTDCEDKTPGRKLRKRTTRNVNKSGRSVAQKLIETAGCSYSVASQAKSVVTVGDGNEVVLDVNEFQNLFENEIGGHSQIVILGDQETLPEKEDVATTVPVDDAGSALPVEPITNSEYAEIVERIDRLEQQLKEYQKIVLRQLVNISSDLGQVIRVVTQNTVVCYGEDIEIPGASIPINSGIEFNIVNDWLQIRENKLKFINFLKGIGGVGTENFVKRILSRIIGGDLANKTNFSGTREKFKFQDTEMMSCIIAAVRKLPEDTSPTASEVETIVKVWLRGSGDRNGGRAKRQSNNQQK